MKVAVIGSRTFTNRKLMEEVLSQYEITEIISGGAAGADTLAASFAMQKGIKTQIHKPNYERFGKSAPLIRNRIIVENADLVIAFWDGKSRGTKYTMDYATKRGIKVIQALF